jgi:hypothetical protein
MSDPLHPIWDAFLTADNALKVVHRCATLSAVDSERPFRNTRFHGLAGPQCCELELAARREIEDAALLALYAAFEARLREHVTARIDHLRADMDATSPVFGSALIDMFRSYCDAARMDSLIHLFADSVGHELTAKVGAIRQYRHWVAHGRRGAAPPKMPPRAAYDSLSRFLSLCGLT